MMGIAAFSKWYTRGNSEKVEFNIKPYEKQFS